ncbi:MAG: FxsA family protein [Pirellulaceae bacterium]
MLFRLFFLFIVVPFIELVILLKLAEWTSPEFTVLLVLITGAVGITLARVQGFRTYWRIQAELSQGRMPTDSLLDAVMILVAGALLLTPGVLTDAFGLSLLVPVCRRFYRAWLVRWFKRRFQVHFQGSAPGRPGASQVIDSYVVERHPEEDEPDQTLPRE